MVPLTAQLPTLNWEHDLSVMKRVFGRALPSTNRVNHKQCVRSESIFIAHHSLQYWFLYSNIPSTQNILFTAGEQLWYVPWYSSHIYTHPPLWCWDQNIPHAIAKLDNIFKGQFLTWWQTSMLEWLVHLISTSLNMGRNPIHRVSNKFDLSQVQLSTKVI